MIFAIYVWFCILKCLWQSYESFLIGIQAQKCNQLTKDQQQIVTNARLVVSAALEVDEKGEKEKALELYIKAVEHCRSAVSYHIALSLYF